MSNPRNIEYILRWTKENTPDLLDNVQQTLAVEGGSASFLIGFESGRLFQLENPEVPLGDPNSYGAQQQPQGAQADAVQAIVSRDEQRFGCPQCRKLVGSVDTGLLPSCPKCGVAILPPDGWTVGS